MFTEFEPAIEVNDEREAKVDTQRVECGGGDVLKADTLQLFHVNAKQLKKRRKQALERARKVHLRVEREVAVSPRVITDPLPVQPVTFNSQAPIRAVGLSRRRHCGPSLHPNAYVPVARDYSDDSDDEDSSLTSNEE